jgi:dienelactone hydrolase
MILIGEKDDWTPAEPCRRLVENSRAAGYPMQIRIYPGAHHAFDNASPVRYNAQRNNPNAPSGHGATTGGDAEAWADARVQVSAFFSLHLKN